MFIYLKVGPFLKVCTLEQEEVTLAYLTLEDGEWNQRMLKSLVTQEILSKLLLIHIPRHGNGEDICIWGGTYNGSFDAFNRLSSYEDINRHNQRCAIWKIKVPYRIDFSVWLIYHNGIKTKHFLHHRRIFDPNCGEYEGVKQTILHALGNFTMLNQVFEVACAGNLLGSVFQCKFTRLVGAELKVEFGQEWGSFGVAINLDYCFHTI